MELERLTIAGKSATRLGVGTLTMSPLQTNLDVDAAGELLAQALAEGIRLVDTAQMYGSYPQVRRGLELAGQPDVVIATKATVATAEEMRAAVEEARRALGRDRLDIFLLHAVRSEEDLRRREGALNVLLEYRNKDVVGAVGVSSHSLAFARCAAADPRLEAFHLMLNVRGVGITDGTREQMEAVLATIRQRRGIFYAMKPLGGGYLRSEAETALAWVRDHPLVDAAVVGMTSRDELEMALRVFRREPVPAGLAQRIRGQAKRLFINRALCAGCSECVTFCDQQAATVVDGKAVIDPERCIACGYCIPRCPSFAMRIV